MQVRVPEQKQQSVRILKDAKLKGLLPIISVAAKST